MPKLSMKPITKRVALLKFDPSGETVGTFRQIPQSSVSRLADLFAERVERIRDGGLVVENVLTWNSQKLLAERVYESLIDLNLEAIVGVDDDGNEITEPLFTFGKGPHGPVPGPRNKFMETWGNIYDSNLIDALYEGALEVNPQWNPERQGE